MAGGSAIFGRANLRKNERTKFFQADPVSSEPMYTSKKNTWMRKQPTVRFETMPGLQGQAEIPFERLKAEGLNPLSREYIIDKMNLRRVQKDCLISFAGNQYSVPAEYIGKDVAVIAMDNMLCAYHDGKQIAVLSYQKKFMVVNPVHYQSLTVKQSFDTPNTLFDKGGIIDFPMKAADLSRYDEVIYE